MNTCLKNINLWTKDELKIATQGKDLTSNFLKNKNVNGISIDTRSIRKNDLFIAIKGKNYDGHKFLAEAIKKGASGVIVSCEDCAIRYDGFFVKNTYIALKNNHNRMII